MTFMKGNIWEIRGSLETNERMKSVKTKDSIYFCDLNLIHFISKYILSEVSYFTISLDSYTFNNFYK